ncbi:MAG: class I SAM-dependent methyltransferase [Chloroflexi bacterium]|nr:class I SAM-dependent methyltransferase [Chloroflexota bacterium]
MDRRDAALRHLDPYIRRARSFAGWSFDDVAVRPLEPGPPWDYEAIARSHAGNATSLLDLGTGGGEALARVAAGLSPRIAATEWWEVNAPIAQRKLASLGAGVVRCSSLRLPFRDACVDLVLDRHEELDPAEVARVLQPGGRLVTQQVGRDDWAELWPFFPNRQVFGDHFTAYGEGLRSAGMTVTGDQHKRKVVYQTLGDVVFMLLVAPWWAPGFDPVQDIDQLLALEDALKTGDGIVVTESRYLIIAQKPGW